MLNKILITPVDELVEIVKQNKKCTILFLKNKLNVPLEILERWLTILEEYKVVVVHYTGFEGYVSYVQNVPNKLNKNQSVSIENLKERFIERSKIKQFDYNKMKALWPIFILEYEAEIKSDFYEKAKNRDYELEKIEKAWIKYRKSLEEL